MKKQIVIIIIITAIASLAIITTLEIIKGKTVSNNTKAYNIVIERQEMTVPEDNITSIDKPIGIEAYSIEDSNITPETKINSNVPVESVTKLDDEEDIQIWLEGTLITFQEAEKNNMVQEKEEILKEVRKRLEAEQKKNRPLPKSSAPIEQTL